jgi:hypothetical protein
MLFALLNGAVRSFFVFAQSENDDALEVLKLIAHDFECVHQVGQLVAFDFKSFAHCSRKFFSGLPGGGEFLLGFCGDFKSDSSEFGQGFHKYVSSRIPMLCCLLSCHALKTRRGRLDKNN